MRLLAGFVVALLPLTVLSPARAQVPATVLGPRPPARVIDETGSLSAADRTEIARLAGSIHDTTRADMVVVVIPTGVVVFTVVVRVRISVIVVVVVPSVLRLLLSRAVVATRSVSTVVFEFLLRVVPARRVPVAAKVE